MTLRELDWMADGRLRSEWDRTSSVIAAIVAVDSKRGKFEPEKFNPYSRRRPAKRLPKKEQNQSLKDAFGL